MAQRTGLTSRRRGGRYLGAKSGRRQRIRYPFPAFRLRGFVSWLHTRPHGFVIVGQAVLTLVAVVHLALVFLLPGGRNDFLEIDATPQLPHLTFWRTGDAFGFPSLGDRDGFIRYEVYAQNGSTLEGVFPNPHVKPDLRYLRWAAAGEAVSGDRSELHTTLLQYLLGNLSSPPLKVELYAGEWDPQEPPGAKGEPEPRVAAQWRLGSHDGLTQAWESEAENEAK